MLPKPPGRHRLKAADKVLELHKDDPQIAETRDEIVAGIYGMVGQFPVEVSILQDFYHMVAENTDPYEIVAHMELKIPAQAKRIERPRECLGPPMQIHGKCRRQIALERQLTAWFSVSSCSNKQSTLPAAITRGTARLP